MTIVDVCVVVGGTVAGTTRGEDFSAVVSFTVPSMTVGAGRTAAITGGERGAGAATA